MMESKLIYLKEDDITDIDKIDEYNAEYQKEYPDFVPFVTKENFIDFLIQAENSKKGVGNNGVCEIYYWAIENNKIIGHGSIRLNPEVDKDTEKYGGHIMYGVVPSKRKQGYGTLLCHLLIEKASELGFKEVVITCNENNVGSSSIIENNGGQLIETINNKDDNGKTRRYVVDVDTSLKIFSQNKGINRNL